MLSTSTQQFDELSNIFKHLQRVTCQALKRWLTTSAGIRDFGSVMEVQHASVVRGFKQAETCDDTADG
jgi:hypothetical protein